MSLGKTITLSSGRTIPQIGLGTWLSKPNEVENAVEIAIRHGYRHIDCAFIYFNQDEVGRALKKVIPSVVKREELFITSKLWNTAHKPELVEAELDETLKQLGTDYVDLYLVHWPIAMVPGKGPLPMDPETGKVLFDTDVTLVETWKAVIKLKETGKVRDIGVSNFQISHLQGIIDATGVVPTVHQIEAHPFLPQDDLVEFCKKHNIHITAYSPLGNNLIGKPKITDYPEIQEVAKHLNATPAQVLIAWGAYRGYSVIPKSVQEDRIKSNFEQVELTEEDYQKINELGRKNITRFNIPLFYQPSWDFNVFDEPVEQTASVNVKIQ